MFRNIPATLRDMRWLRRDIAVQRNGAFWSDESLNDFSPKI